MTRTRIAMLICSSLLVLSACKFKEPTVHEYATGLTNPRGLAFGPDGHLYVAEAGTGGDLEATDEEGCPKLFNIYSPYKAGFTGRVMRVLKNGTTQVVADGLPSMTDTYGGAFGPTDLAFIGKTLYVLIEMGGCPHGLPDDLHLPAIFRINPDGTTTNVADLGAWHAANPPNFIKETDPTKTDQEPGGVFHSMIAVNDKLYLVETNRGFLLRVNPANGVIEKLYDMSVDNAEHNPLVMVRRDKKFYVGTFGEDDGPAELAVFDKDFSSYELPFQSLHPLVGLAWSGNTLYGIEVFSHDSPWMPDTGNLVSFDPRSGERTELLDDFASFPNGLIVGPDGALYTSNWGSSGAPGDGGILRITR